MSSHFVRFYKHFVSAEILHYGSHKVNHPGGVFSGDADIPYMQTSGCEILQVINTVCLHAESGDRLMVILRSPFMCFGTKSFAVADTDN